MIEVVVVPLLLLKLVSFIARLEPKMLNCVLFHGRGVCTILKFKTNKIKRRLDNS